MASQITKITNDLKTQALTAATVSSVSTTLYNNWTALGMVFTPASANTVYAILNRYFDIGQQSLDVALAARDLDRNQLGQRIQTDQQGGG